MNLARTLDSEFKRIAREENLTMDTLVSEIARLTGKSERQLYNFRSGKWELAPSLFPILCKRFRSLALVDALREECSETQIDVPESYDLTCLVSRTVRDDLKHYEQFLVAYESDGIDGRELEQLRASGARIVQNVRQFEAIAVADHERRRRPQTV